MEIPIVPGDYATALLPAAEKPGLAGVSGDNLQVPWASKPMLFVFCSRQNAVFNNLQVAGIVYAENRLT
jgi:hypothetical protein